MIIAVIVIDLVTCSDYHSYGGGTLHQAGRGALIFLFQIQKASTKLFVSPAHSQTIDATVVCSPNMLDWILPLLVIAL